MVLNSITTFHQVIHNCLSPGLQELPVCLENYFALSQDAVGQKFPTFREPRLRGGTVSPRSSNPLLIYNMLLDSLQGSILSINLYLSLL